MHGPPVRKSYQLINALHGCLKAGIQARVECGEFHGGPRRMEVSAHAKRQSL